MQKITIKLEAAQLEGTQALLANWLIEPNSTVDKDQPIAELETDKVAIEITAPQAGTVETLLKTPGEEVIAGDALAVLTPLAGDRLEQADTNPANSYLASKPEHELPDTPSKRHLMGPAVKKLISTHNLNVDLIQGSGEGGRISKKDVLTYVAQAPSENCALRKPKDTKRNESHHIPHSTMRKRIADHMVESLLQTSPHVSSVFEMDMSAIIAHRNARKLGYHDAGANLTFTAYFLAASAAAIAEVPSINSQFHEHSLEVFKEINIGVGTALGDRGLVVPVVRDVANKSLFEIAKTLTTQTERARNRELIAKDMQGGTFTISNYGTGGSLLATPIVINQPQVAILGVGKMQKRVVVEEIEGEDKITVKPMCYVSLTIDHRAIDAYQTNHFLSVFIETIENWQ
ncbi:MAG: dihydrolipoamide acetyltransferase family protein [Pseudomonadales bacterium]